MIENEDEGKSQNEEEVRQPAGAPIHTHPRTRKRYLIRLHLLLPWLTKCCATRHRQREGGMEGEREGSNRRIIPVTIEKNVSRVVEQASEGGSEADRRRAGSPPPGDEWDSFSPQGGQTLRHNAKRSRNEVLKLDWSCEPFLKTWRSFRTQKRWSAKVGGCAGRTGGDGVPRRRL